MLCGGRRPRDVTLVRLLYPRLGRPGRTPSVAFLVCATSHGCREEDMYMRLGHRPLYLPPLEGVFLGQPPRRGGSFVGWQEAGRSSWSRANRFAITAGWAAAMFVLILRGKENRALTQGRVARSMMGSLLFPSLFFPAWQWWWLAGLGNRGHLRAPFGICFQRLRHLSRGTLLFETRQRVGLTCPGGRDLPPPSGSRRQGPAGSTRQASKVGGKHSPRKHVGAATSRVLLSLDIQVERIQ